MTDRENAHRLLDAVPEDQVDTVVRWLKQITESNKRRQPHRRTFRTLGVFDGDPDLGAHAKEIVRRELGAQDDESG